MLAKELITAVENLLDYFGKHDAHPKLVIKYLNILNDLERNFPLPKELRSNINECYKRCIPFISRAYGKNNAEQRDNYYAEGLGIVDSRIEFLKEQVDESYKELLLAITQTRRDAYEANTKQINPVLENELKEKLNELNTILEYADSNSEVYINALEQHAENSFKLGRYMESASYYSRTYQILKQSHSSEDLIAKVEQQAQRILMTVLMQLPKCTSNLILEAVDKKTLKYSTQEDIIWLLNVLEENGDLLLLNTDDAIALYKQALEIIKDGLVPARAKVLKITPEGRELFLAKQKEIFIKLACGLTKAYDNQRIKCFPLRHQEELKIKRNHAIKALEASENPQKICEDWNKNLIQLVRGFISGYEGKLGEAPCDYVILGLGSLSRREASFYSDLDIMIITQTSIKHQPSEVRKYFEVLIELINMQIRLLGERPLDNDKHDRDPKIGIGCDIMGYFPKLSDKYDYSIGTAREVLDGADKEINVFNDIIVLGGRGNVQAIMQSYDDALKEFNKGKADKLVADIKESYHEYDIEDGLSLLDKPNINIKGDLLRFPCLLVNRLCAYYGLCIAKNKETEWQSVTHKKIELLTQAREKVELQSSLHAPILDYFSPNNALRLKEYLVFAQSLRLKAHAYYGEENEVIYLSGKEGFVLSEVEKLKLSQLYEIVIRPLRDIVGICDLPDNERALACYNKSKDLLFKYSKTADQEYVEEANWYFEKAVEYNLEAVEPQWVQEIRELRDINRKDGIRLELIIGDDPVQFVLNEEAEKQFLDPNNKEVQGRRNVTRMVHNGNYYHIKEYPEVPGVEYAVASLSHLLFGYTTTPFSILGNIITKKGVGIPILISRTVIGEICNEKSLSQVDNESYGFAFTKTLLVRPEDDKPENYIISTSKSPGGEIKKRLFCVDNDHGFLKNAVQNNLLTSQVTLKSLVYCLKEKIKSEFHNRVAGKLLNVPISETLIKWLERTSAQNERNKLLFDLEENARPKTHIITKHGNEDKVMVDIPFTLSQDMLLSIFYKLLQLQDILSQNLKKRYLNVLIDLDHEVGVEYRKLLVQGKDGLAMFQDLSRGQYDVKTIKNAGDAALTSISVSKIRYVGSESFQVKGKNLAQSTQALKTIIARVENLSQIRNDFLDRGVLDINLPIELKQMLINGRGSEAHGIFVENIFKFIIKKAQGLNFIDKAKEQEYIEEKQRQVLNLIKGQTFIVQINKFTSGFKRLNLSNCTVLKDKELESILSSQILWLDISNCSNLGSNALNIIAGKCGALKTLYIDRDIDPNSIRLEENSTINKVFKNLTKIGLISELSIEKEVLVQLIEKSPSFKKVIISGSEYNKEDSINLLNHYEKKIMEEEKEERRLEIITSLNCSEEELGRKLWSAAWFGRKKAVELLLHKNANIKAVYKGEQETIRRRLIILMIGAALSGKKEAVELLLAEGVDIEDRIFGNNGDPSFGIEAAILARDEKTAIIWNCNKSPTGSGHIWPSDNYDTPALVAAARLKQEEMVEFLLTKKANVNSSDAAGKTALSFTNNKPGYERIVKLLLERKESIAKKAVLLNVVWNGNKEEVELLLEQKANIEIRDEHGRTPLMIACERGEIEIINLLLDKGANIKTSNNVGDTALILAVKNGYKEVAALLLDRGANINEVCWTRNNALACALRKGYREMIVLLLNRGISWSMALILASNHGYKEMACFLLDRGANINAIDNGWNTIMFWAVRNGHKEVVALLLDRGANVNAASKDGKTPLMMACEQRKWEIFELLLAKGANIEGYKEVALIAATEGGNREIIELVLEKGANIEAKNKDGKTPLIIACEQRKWEIFELLLAKGANIEGYKEVALIAATEGGNREIIELVLEKGANIEAKNKDGKTPLIIACERGKKEVIELLLAKKADIEVRDNARNVALEAKNIHKETITPLLDNISAVDKHRNFKLIWAAKSGHRGVVAFLLDQGTNINVVDKDGNTALIWASKNSHKKVVAFLLDRSADIDVANNKGDTALTLASGLYQKKIIELLQGHSINVDKEKILSTQSQKETFLLSSINIKQNFLAVIVPLSQMCRMPEYRCYSAIFSNNDITLRIFVYALADGSLPGTIFHSLPKLLAEFVSKRVLGASDQQTILGI